MYSRATRYTLCACSLMPSSTIVSFHHRTLSPLVSSNQDTPSVPKLVSQLYEEAIFTTVGGHQFRVPRDVFSTPGNTPNFFTLGFAAFFSRPDDLFPGLDREGLLRPPSIVPPSVPGRSADTFAELLHLLRGYPVNIRSDAHRAELLRDCRYFNFKGLEQTLIPHAVSFNLARARDEIVLRLRDILKSGISVASEPAPADPFVGWVHYARPFVDDRGRELVLEIGEESTRLRFAAGGFAPSANGFVGALAEFVGETRTRVAKLFEVVAAKLNLPPRAAGFAVGVGAASASLTHPTPGLTPLSEDLVKVVLDPEASVVLDGRAWTPAVAEEEFLFGTHLSVGDAALSSRKRRRVDEATGATTEEWIVRTGQWRLKIQGTRNGKAAVECCLVAVKLDAYSSEQARNEQRSFLGG